MSEESRRSAFPVPDAAAALLLRLSLGMLFLIAALNKFLSEGGAAGVSQTIVDSFKDTYLPAFAVVPYSYVLPYVELALGLGLIVGVFTRHLLFACGLLLISLALGMAVKQEFATVTQNLNYVFMTAVGLWFSARDNRYSLDYYLGRK